MNKIIQTVIQPTVYLGVICPVCGIPTEQAHSVYTDKHVCNWCDLLSECGQYVPLPYTILGSPFVCVDCLYPE
jgi:hypothetical protein